MHLHNDPRQPVAYTLRHFGTITRPVTPTDTTVPEPRLADFDYYRRFATLNGRIAAAIKLEPTLGPGALLPSDERSVRLITIILGIIWPTALGCCSALMSRK